MKKYINTLWMCLFLVFAMTSCSDDESTSESESVILPKITLDSESEIIATDNAKQFFVSFTVNKEWTISSNQTWCSPVIKNGGPGKITVPINLERNESYDSREACISIFSGTVKQSIKVTQAQKDAIVLANNRYEVQFKESKLSFEVQSNVKFQLDADVNWIKQEFDETRGLITYKLDVHIEENTDVNQRVGHIFIMNDDIKQTITITQRGNKPQEIVIVHNQSTFMVPQIGGSLIDGQILWGDNQEEMYVYDAKHTYGTAGNHIVTIKIQGAEGMNMQTIEGVVSIDLSKF